MIRSTFKHKTPASKVALAILGVSLAGCLSDQALAEDYLPGSNETAKGPGILSMGHYDSQNHGGTVVFSTDKNQSAFIHPGDVAGRQSGAHASAPQPATTPARSNVTEPVNTESANDYPQFKSYQRYKKFEQYQHFKQLPANSPERRKFRRCQEWQKNRH